MGRASLVSPVLLVGPAGSGKTLIGWLLRRALAAGHTADPDDILKAPAGLSTLIVDNADLSDGTARAVLGAAQSRGWTSAIVVARAIEPGGVPAVHLSAPTVEDVKMCLANALLPVASDRWLHSENLWHLIRRVLANLEME